MIAPKRAVPDAHVRLLERFAAGHPEHALRLGAGAEAIVYAVDEDRVLRVYRGTPPASGSVDQQAWRSASFPIPYVLDSGEDDGLHWQLMRRFRGRTVHNWLREMTGPGRADLLQRYVDAAFEVAAIDSARAYGTLIGPATYPTWAACLRARLDRSASSRAQLADAVPHLPLLLAGFDELTPRLYDGEPRLAHVDYFPGNVMAEQTAATFAISGVFDFSDHSLFGDPLLDVVGAIVMADMSTNVTSAEQQAMREYARQRGGPRFDAVFGCYQLFYALYYAMDESLLPWCVKVLRQVELT